MVKVTFMGAGSTVFARNVIGDCMCTPSLQDRALITVWGPYAGLKTMIAVLADPFPFQPHVLQTVHLAANEAEHYELHCAAARSAAMTVSLSVRGRSIAQFSPSNASSILLPIGPLPRDA